MNTRIKRSTATWIWDFAGEYRSRYVLSVLSAVCGVICGILPYFVMANMIGDLLGGCRDMNIYLQHCLAMALLWVGRCGFHGISTTLSHKATFAVLGNIRKRVCEKLTRVPLGTVLDMPSGSVKNVLVERIDSIETTMAHIIPEFTSNLLVPIALLVYLFVLDWRMALAVLVTVPIGFGCYAGMTRGYAESYQNTVDKTKILNDTAVEYINGIEVIRRLPRHKAPMRNSWSRPKRVQAVMWNGCGDAISISALPCPFSHRPWWQFFPSAVCCSVPVRWMPIPLFRSFCSPLD